MSSSSSYLPAAGMSSLALREALRRWISLAIFFFSAFCCKSFFLSFRLLCFSSYIFFLISFARPCLNSCFFFPTVKA